MLMRLNYDYGTMALEISPPNTPVYSIQMNDDENTETLDYLTFLAVWITTKYKEGQSIEEYLDDLTKSNDDIREDYEVIKSDTNVSFAGRPGYLLIEQSGNEDDLSKNLYIGTFLDNDKVVEIEFIAPPQDYDKYLPIVNQIINSFRLIDDRMSLGMDNSNNFPPFSTSTPPPSPPPPDNQASGGADVGFGGTPVNPSLPSGTITKPKF